MPCVECHYCLQNELCPGAAHHRYCRLQEEEEEEEDVRKEVLSSNTSERTIPVFESRLRTMTVASNFLTGKTDTVNCTTGTAEPGTFVGNTKSNSNVSVANVWDSRTPRLDLRCVDLWELSSSFLVLQTKGQVLRTWCRSHRVMQYSIDQTGVKTTNEETEAPDANEIFTLVPILQGVISTVFISFRQ